MQRRLAYLDCQNLSPYSVLCYNYPSSFKIFLLDNYYLLLALETPMRIGALSEPLNGRGGIGRGNGRGGKNGTVTGKACPKGLYGIFCEVSFAFFFFMLCDFVKYVWL